MAATHKVKGGETLWSISKQHLGAGHLWPSIYIHNNSAEIVRQRGNASDRRLDAWTMESAHATVW